MAINQRGEWQADRSKCPTCVFYIQPISLLVCVEMSKSIVLLNSRHVHRYQISMEKIELNKNNKNKNEKKNTEKSANEQA
ncbi:hypothetical protein T05_5293 [Trichinella murrelli]|uniref:Uncharacterized protein n=1 Tax=Trichinella murrelli TaxID=144512 RepID=A0A0V0TV22_9BILA|nr:hypothetical protein T05_5293 [Trichinella murrelli]